jgi:hypothetical protein
MDDWPATGEPPASPAGVSMKILALSVSAGLLLGGGNTIATKYTTDRALRIEMESSMKMTTTSREVEVDGEPQEMPAGGMSSETTYEEIDVDHPLAVADGKPTKLRRTFEKIGGTTSTTRGDQSNDRDLESSFKGVTLELVEKDGEVEAEVVDGKKLDGEKPLEGHRLETYIDGLLPKKAVEVDDTYDLDKEDIRRALRLDLRKTLYARPSSDSEGGDSGGGRRRGGRGMGGGMGGGMADDADWKGTAKLVSADKEIDGVSCSVIEIKVEARGEREMTQPQGRRGQAFGMESTAANTMSYDETLEGKLVFSNKDKRPVSLKLQGTLHIESRMEFTRNESTTKSHSVQDGKIDYKVDVSDEAPKTEEKK